MCVRVCVCALARHRVRRERKMSPTILYFPYLILHTLMTCACICICPPLQSMVVEGREEGAVVEAEEEEPLETEGDVTGLEAMYAQVSPKVKLQ